MHNHERGLARDEGRNEMIKKKGQGYRAALNICEKGREGTRPWDVLNEDQGGGWRDEWDRVEEK